jgi:ribosomal-protein-alanine N-acetyltransferase
VIPDSLPPIESDRLSLRWMSPAFIQASLQGRPDEAAPLIDAHVPAWWPDDAARLRLKMRLAQLHRDPDSAPWLLRALVRRTDRSFVGVINFHGRPDAKGRAELGYAVFEAYRRHGYASEAATTMMRWACDEHGVHDFVLSISPQNEPSLRMAAKLGFERTGSQVDEIDGEEWVFERHFGQWPG